MRPPRIGNRLQQALARGADRFFAEHELAADEEVTYYPEYADDFPRFFVEKLHRRPWRGDGTVPGQLGILEALNKHDRVVVASATGIGKTVLAGGVIEAWLTTRKNSKVIAVSKTWSQVESQLFAEVRTAFAEAKRIDPKYPGRCLRTKREINPKWYALGLSPREPENVAGHHATLAITPEVEENIARWLEMTDEEFFAPAEGEEGLAAPVLVVVDEGGVVLDEVYDALDGVLTGRGCKMLVLGNLTRDRGRMVEMWSRNPPTTRNRVCFRDEEEPEDVPKPPPPPPSSPEEDDPGYVHTMRITAFDAPDAIINRDFIERMRVECGSNYMRNPRYMVRVLALPPLGGENSMFPLPLLEECSELRPGVGGTHMGVDLNFGGDDESWAALEIDGRIRAMYCWQVGAAGLDNYDAAKVIYDLAKGWGVEAKNVHYDIGNGGCVVGDILRRRFNFHADGVDFGSSAVGDWRAQLGWPGEGLKLRRHELHWNALRRFQEGLLSIPFVAEQGGALGKGAPNVAVFEKAIAQLTAIQYPKGDVSTWRPEKKAIYTAREGCSPDAGEAVLLAGARTDGTGPRLTTIKPKRRARRGPRKFTPPVDPRARVL